MTDKIAVAPLLEKLIVELQHYMQSKSLTDPILVGIRTGGVWLAEHIHRQCQITQPLGILDIAFYRDDFSHIGLHPQVKPCHLPVSIENKHVILIDDVIQTGRTIRAAMNTLFDYGRPASVTLGCLVTLSGHELPIQADVMAETVNLAEGQRIKLTGPQPLQLEVITL